MVISNCAVKYRCIAISDNSSTRISHSAIIVLSDRETYYYYYVIPRFVCADETPFAPGLYPSQQGWLNLFQASFIGNAAVYGFKWIEAARISLESNVIISPFPFRPVNHSVRRHGDIESGQSTYTARNVNTWSIRFARIRSMIFVFFFFYSRKENVVGQGLAWIVFTLRKM